MSVSGRGAPSSPAATTRRAGADHERPADGLDRLARAHAGARPARRARSARRPRRRGARARGGSRPRRGPPRAAGRVQRAQPRVEPGLARLLQVGEQDGRVRRGRWRRGRAADRDARLVRRRPRRRRRGGGAARAASRRARARPAGAPSAARVPGGTSSPWSVVCRPMPVEHGDQPRRGVLRVGARPAAAGGRRRPAPRRARRASRLEALERVAQRGECTASPHASTHSRQHVAVRPLHEVEVGGEPVGAGRRGGARSPAARRGPRARPPRTPRRRPRPWSRSGS